MPDFCDTNLGFKAGKGGGGGGVPATGRGGGGGGAFVATGSGGGGGGVFVAIGRGRDSGAVFACGRGDCTGLLSTGVGSMLGGFTLIEKYSDYSSPSDGARTLSLIDSFYCSSIVSRFA